MEIRLNDENEIREFSIVGGLSDGIEVEDSIKPVDFDYLFKPSYYLYQDNQIIVNPNYEEPSIEIPETPESSGPSPEMLAINALGIQLAKHLAGGD